VRPKKETILKKPAVMERRGLRPRPTVLGCVGILCVLLAAGAARAANASAGGAVLQRVDDHYNRLRSLRVEFTESYAGAGMQRQESGTLLLQKPGRMRWNYADPAGKVFLIDGKFGYSYTPGDAQAQRYPAKQLDDLRSPLRFLLGHAQLKKELANPTVVADGDGFRITGLPRGLGDRVTGVTLKVDREGRIQTIAWKENDGSQTEFRLSGEADNPTLPAGTFTFQAPPGVVVVRGLAPM
jgi:outer membrane lipoprotein carrier protein